MTDLIEYLTNAETDLLAQCELTIERGLASFLEVGQALADVRDNRLYRAFPTFEAYCAGRWGISRPRAYELMTAAAVVSGMPDIEVPLPANARQAVELAKVPEADRAEVWTAAVENTNGKPTAAAVREAANALNPETPASPPAPVAADENGPSSPPGGIDETSTDPRTSSVDPTAGSGAGKSAGPADPDGGRPVPPRMTAEERRAHDATVLRAMDVDAARWEAQLIVTNFSSAVSTIVAGCQLGATGLVTADMVRALRTHVDRLESQL